MSVLFSNTRTRLLYNEREIFNTARSEAECSIENFEFGEDYSVHETIYVLLSEIICFPNPPTSTIKHLFPSSVF